MKKLILLFLLFFGCLAFASNSKYDLSFESAKTDLEFKFDSVNLMKKTNSQIQFVSSHRFSEGTRHFAVKNINSNNLNLCCVGSLFMIQKHKGKFEVGWHNFN